MTVQQRRREQHQVRREVAREHGAQQGEPPTSGAERTQLRQPPFAERREVAADPHHRVRTSRAAYAPSTAWCCGRVWKSPSAVSSSAGTAPGRARANAGRSEEHTSELQSRLHLVCRLLLEKKKQSERRKSSPPPH